MEQSRNPTPATGRADRVSVGIRVRASGGGSCIDVDAEQRSVLLQRSPHGAARRFTYDHTFGVQATNRHIYEAVGRPLLSSALDGYNATLLAYGQTGGGKTHTMMGSVRDRGVVMRLVDDLFRAPGRRSVRFSMLEIYNERIRDLFSTARTNLRVREDPATGPFVEDLSWYVAEDCAAMEQLLEIGTQARTVRSTTSNQQSSRAHTVVQISVVSLADNGDGGWGGGRNGTSHGGRFGQTSNICLVDLAGSERHDTASTMATTARSATIALREGCAINQSLTNLGLCISALCSRSSTNHHHIRGKSVASHAGSLGSAKHAHVHVPYRNSSLTWLLRESIGGNSATAIVACLNDDPRCREESLSTLRFADGAKHLTSHLHRKGAATSVSSTAPKGGVLREVAGTCDAAATIAALREELRQLQSKLHHDVRAGVATVPPCRTLATHQEPDTLPDEMLPKCTAVNGKVLTGSVALRDGDRVTVFDGLQEHEFLHVESRSAATAACGDRQYYTDPAAMKDSDRSDADDGEYARHGAYRHDANEKGLRPQVAAASAIDTAAGATLLGMDDSMFSFLEMEEAANRQRAPTGQRLPSQSSKPTPDATTADEADACASSATREVEKADLAYAHDMKQHSSVLGRVAPWLIFVGAVVIPGQLTGTGEAVTEHQSPPSIAAQVTIASERGSSASSQGGLAASYTGSCLVLAGGALLLWLVLVAAQWPSHAPQEHRSQRQVTHRQTKVKTQAALPAKSRGVSKEAIRAKTPLASSECGRRKLGNITNTTRNNWIAEASISANA
jgi:hypothetical protein